MYRRRYYGAVRRPSSVEPLYDEENAEWETDARPDELFADGMEAMRDGQAYEGVMRSELLHHLGNLMRQQLSEDEQSIVERYFGIGCEAHRPARIAEDFGLRERDVEAVVSEAVRKLRECDYAIYLYQYLHGKRI